MAFKASNQITFTEHKKIIEIQEWYLVSSTNTTPNINDTKWSRNIPSIDSTNRYLWNYERVVYSLGEDDISEPAIIGVYGDAGAAATIAFLTNENVTLSANSSGQVAATTFETDVVAYSGTEAKAVTLGVISNLPEGVSEPSITYKDNKATIKFTVPNNSTLGNAANCDGAINIEVTKPIEVDLKLTWSKVNSGADGAPNPKSITLSTTSHIIKVDENGNTTPSIITITPTISTTDSGETFVWRFSKDDGEFYTTMTGVTVTKDNADASVSIENDSYVTINTQDLTATKSAAIMLRTPNTAQDKYQDIITIHKVYDGEKGADGAPGASASVVFLTNENVTFGSDPDGKVAATTFSTNVVAYTGAQKVDVTVGNITDCPNGIIAGPPTTSGNEKTITFTVQEDSTLGNQEMGEIKIPITSPVETELVLTWNKVRNGADGVGQDAKYVKLNATSQVVKVGKNGAITPKTITIRPEKFNIADTETFQWEYNVNGGGFSTTLPPGTVNDNERTVIYTTMTGFSDVNTLAVKYVSTNSDNPYSDVITIYRMIDGADGEKGEDGRGITSITNYYQVTKDTTAPTTWVTTVPELTPTNKYLWNYEEISYTKGNPTTTEPAIIGAYGDSGDGMVTFEIYSPRGFVFKEDLSSIDLKIAAFMGNTAITNATYKWEWWNDSLYDGEGGYSTIVENVTSDTFTVNKDDEYALAALKCTMMYDGQTYDDYVSLMNETVIYTSVVKFFDGSNIFYSDDLYIVAYIELYQNNEKIETVSADTYCTGVSSITNDTITANITGNFSTGDRMYFVCRDNDLYKVILGEFSGSAWKVIDNTTNYTYTNSLYPTMNSNVIAISKESINKSQNVDFSVLKNGICISNTSANIIDSNDPVISSSPPENPVYNQLWLDTSKTPYVLKIFTQTDGADGNNSGEWVDCSEQIGGSVFTSKPTTYHKGDLWILGENETCDKYDEDGNVCGSYGPGSMLRATSDSATSPMIAYLTNENIILGADANGQVAETIFTTDVIACSTTSSASSLMLGNIAGLPSGITYKSVSGINGKQTITFMVADKSTLGSSGNCSGTISIPVVSPIEKTLNLKWSKVNNAYDEASGAKNIVLSATSQTIKVDGNGNISPSSIKIIPTMSNVTDSEMFMWNFSKDGESFYTGINGVTRYPSGTGSFYANVGPYVTVDPAALNLTDEQALTVKLRTVNNAAVYYEDVITIYKLSHTATFNASDWVDADEETTELKNNIKQYFSFSTDNGLKIGQIDEKFYVNINSTEMGFYDNSVGQNQKVVSISNSAATIKNLTVQEGAQFDCDATFTEPVRMFNFMWQEETNGSFSLVVVSE